MSHGSEMSGATTIHLVHCDTSLSHRVDCGLLNVNSGCCELGGSLLACYNDNVTMHCNHCTVTILSCKDAKSVSCSITC